MSQPHITSKLCGSLPLCVDKAGQPCGLIVFGASGDLTQRKLLGSLYELHRMGLLAKEFYVLGCGRTAMTNEEFRRNALAAIGHDDADAQAFAQQLYYLSGMYDDPDFYQEMAQLLTQLDQKHHVQGPRIFYLAVPPSLFGTIVERLGQADLAGGLGRADQARLIIEKPFGHDLDTARQLTQQLHPYFQENQIYRIDHYLGKETVQNILMFRFANSIFEPVWNRNYIDHVQIVIAESLGVEHRAGYYDQSGALRDMFQNHMLQLLSLIAMEPPVSFGADPIRDEKVKLLQAVRPFKNDDDIAQSVVRAQYGPSQHDGQSLPGYLQEQGVADDSRTETFVAAKLLIDNWRWKGVPFYLRTGKRLARRVTEIAVQFKDVPHSMFDSAGVADLSPNVLVFHIQPEEGIRLDFQAKCPGSKLCIKTLTLDFNYQEVFQRAMSEAYQRLLLDAMQNDQTLFTRYDDVEVAWELIMPILRHWQQSPDKPVTYDAGADSFPAADDLINRDGRTWRPLRTGDNHVCP